MHDIYTQHDAAFRKVEAFVIVKGGERVATIAFKHPASGEGRLYAYVHWFGIEMVRGLASGYGYDKRTAACASAANQMKGEPATPDSHSDWEAFRSALALNGGHHWDSALRNAGFTVWQAV
jgi:hypothetical protein